MASVQLIQLSPEELVELFTKGLKSQINQVTNSNLPAIPEKEVLTRKEVAELFNVSLVSIHDWTSKGILKPYKMGSRTYFKRSEVLETLFNSNRA